MGLKTRCELGNWCKEYGISAFSHLANVKRLSYSDCSGAYGRLVKWGSGFSCDPRQAGGYRMGSESVANTGICLCLYVANMNNNTEEHGLLATWLFEYTRGDDCFC